MQVVGFSSLLDLPREVKEFLVELGSPASLLLLSFELLLIAISVLPLPVASFIELHLRRFAVELHVLGLLLADHDWVDKMHVDDDYQLVLARLEEKMLDVAEEHIDVLAAL